MPNSGSQLEFDLGVQCPAEEDRADCFMEGYMTAIAVCPVDVPIDEVLAGILTEDAAAFAEAGELGELDAAVERVRELLLLAPEDYHPLFIGAGETRRRQAIDWAFGFINGVGIRHEIWRMRMERDDYWAMAGPIFEIASRHPEFPSMFPSNEEIEPLTDAEIEEYIDAVADGVVGLFELRLEAQAVRSEPVKREGAKVGRNDPCPCGSGKKYKKCCGA